MSLPSIRQLTFREVPHVQRHCSLCRSPNHSINLCDSPEILELFHTIDDNMTIIVNDIKENMRILYSIENINQQNLNTVIRNTFNHILSNQSKKSLIVLNKFMIEMYEILEPRRVNTKSSSQDVKDSITNNYLLLIKDIIHFYNGNITSTFKRYISKKIINFIKEFRMNINNENSFQAFYNALRNMKYYNKKIGNRQLYEILGFIKNDFIYSWFYDCLNEEKKVLFSYIQDTLYEYIQNKYHRRHIRITPILLCGDGDGNGYSNGDSNECSICFEEYQKKNEVVLDCGHPFCGNCTIKTITNNLEKQKIPPCPLCRSNIVSVKVFDNQLYNVFISNFA